MFNFDFSLQSVREAFVFLIALILSIAVHEFGHAFAADRLGDGLPRSQGRVTLNPIAHADPVGTLLFPLIIHFTGAPLFGWGKPVMVNPVAFSRKFRMKTAHLIVAIAGPGMNVILALLVTMLLGVLLQTGLLSPNHAVTDGIVRVIHLNWMLFFFNLIPCPPLDGGWVLAGILPDRFTAGIHKIGQFGFIILFGLMFSGILSYLLIPARVITLFFVRLVV